MLSVPLSFSLLSRAQLVQRTLLFHLFAIMSAKTTEFHELVLVPPNYLSLNHLHHSLNMAHCDRDQRQFLYGPRSLVLPAHILRLQTLHLPVDRHPTILPRLAAPQIISQRVFLHN